MTRRRRATASLAVASCGALIAACGGPTSGTPDVAPAQAPRPNVLLIVADDLGWTDLGHAGSGYYETPRLDALAAEGLRFTDAYANSANCAPTRAALMSGLHAARTGVYTVGSGARGSAERRLLVPPPNRTALDADFVTLAERLQAQGYRTGFVGKWHLGSAEQRLLPEDQGFDFAVGGDQQGHPPSHFYPYRRGERGLPGLSPPGLGGTIGDPARSGEYLTDRITEEALRFLDGDQGHPWFLVVSHYAVHTPIQAPEAAVARFRDKPPVGGHADPTYAAMVARLDASVGALLDRLEQDGEARDTLVLFTSDNGGLGGYREAGVPGSPEKTSNAPLRGGKGMFSEGGIRVPLLAYWPGRVPAGAVCAEPVQLFDLYPTLVALAGGEAQAPLPLPDDADATVAPDGADLSALLRDPATGLAREAVYFHFPGYLESGRNSWRTTPVSVVRAGPWKLLEYHEDGHVELYRLDHDLGETQDLSTAQPERAAELRARLHAWLQATDAPMPSQPH